MACKLQQIDYFNNHKYVTNVANIRYHVSSFDETQPFNYQTKYSSNLKYCVELPLIFE